MSDLRKTALPRTEGVLGLPCLDRLLEIFRAPRASTVVQAPRWTSPTLDEATTPSRSTAISPVQTRARPSIVQLSSSNSAAGKTSLCYLLTTLAVLPQAYNGRGSCAIWLDTDGRFYATRLNAVLNNFLSATFPKLSSGERLAISYEALRHLYLFRPQSASQLVATLASLPGYLLGTGGFTTHISASRSLGLLIIDSAVAFYWQDRFEAEVAHFEAVGIDEHPAIRYPARLSRTLDVITELKKMQRLFGCNIVFTSMPHVKSSILTANATTLNDGRLRPQEPPLVSPWTAFATLSLAISQDQVRRFAAQMSLEECQGDQANRLAALARGRSLVSVDWSASDSWANGVRDVVNGLDGQGSFALRITISGTLVEE